MDLDNQALVKALAEQYGTEDLVVVLGAIDFDGIEITVETVRNGDPSYIGPLAGVQLGLDVVHIFEEDIKSQIDPEVYRDQIGFAELSFDSEAVRAAIASARGAAG
jgi:betaine reductase